MPRLPADPVGRLAVLEAARAGCKPGTILNADDMAKVAGMTWRNLKTLIDRDKAFPIRTRGDMGVPWQFSAAKVLNHLIKQAQSAQVDRERRMASVSRLAGLGAAAGALSPGDRASVGSGSAAQMLEGARAVSAVVDAQAKVRGEKQAQGRLVEVEKVSGLLWDMMTTMQTETLAIASKMDPAGQLDPEQRLAIDEHLRNVLLAVRGKVEAALEKWRGPGR
jgi:hypothetical protein